MPLYDYQCPCGNTFESFGKMDDKAMACPECGDKANRIISSRAVNIANEDAPWIRSVLDVVDKKSSVPETREFVKNPTRTNLKRHLQANGLRHVDPGERLGNTKSDFDAKRHAEKIMEQRRKRNMIEVRR